MNENGMDFSSILLELKKGKAVYRKNWNGKGMFLYLVGSNTYPAITDIAKELIGNNILYQKYIALKTVDGTVVPWVASQTDLLSEDWMIVK